MAPSHLSNIEIWSTGPPPLKFMKMLSKMMSAKWQPFCSGLSVLGRQCVVRNIMNRRHKTLLQLVACWARPTVVLFSNVWWWNHFHQPQHNIIFCDQCESINQLYAFKWYLWGIDSLHTPKWLISIKPDIHVVSKDHDYQYDSTCIINKNISETHVL